MAEWTLDDEDAQRGYDDLYYALESEEEEGSTSRTYLVSTDTAMEPVSPSDRLSGNSSSQNEVEALVCTSRVPTFAHTPIKHSISGSDSSSISSHLSSRPKSCSSPPLMTDSGGISEGNPTEYLNKEGGYEKPWWNRKLRHMLLKEEKIVNCVKAKPMFIYKGQLLGYTRNPQSWLDKSMLGGFNVSHSQLAHAKLIQTLVQDFQSKHQFIANASEEKLTDEVQGGPKMQELPLEFVSKQQLCTEVDICPDLSIDQQEQIKSIVQ
ncbi:hypothetical protein M422DRAFT_54049 [Sphaerobolus stellatus SS14]|uniref:Uncharacterized protein n=1 Tax=Sphaerobolus stellatus (strain SS14) TaxID=990650 RepID=A0A0C9UWK0_SPHS4|nr:hypothetical protein M422DRAFT_54049 [Sphaerobolus stellatus SS14]